jgi:hypothetical protein
MRVAVALQASWVRFSSPNLKGTLGGPGTTLRVVFARAYVVMAVGVTVTSHKCERRNVTTWGGGGEGRDSETENAKVMVRE